MFDTLKLIYTQDEAFELVSRYEKVYNEKIEELEEENRKLKEENRKLSEGKIIYASEKEQRHYVDILEENRKLKDKLESLEK